MAELDDREFLLACVEDYYGDSLEQKDYDRFSRLLHDDSFKKLVEQAKEAVGKFQLSFQAYYLSEDQRVRLHDIVEASDMRRTREAQRIEQVGRWEALGDLRRRLSIVLMVVGVIFSVVYYFTPTKKISFKPLESLSYEATQMENEAMGLESLALEMEQKRKEAEELYRSNEVDDAPLDDDFSVDRQASRIDLPTHDSEEIRLFVAAHKNLDFKPHLLSGNIAGWQPEGVSVIDYDEVRVVAVQYISRKYKVPTSDERKLSERMIYFTFKGSVEDLPPTNAQEINGFTYFPFGTEEQNIVVWQVYSDVMGMLVGHRSAQSLAEIAMGGSS